MGHFCHNYSPLTKTTCRHGFVLVLSVLSCWPVSDDEYAVQNIAYVVLTCDLNLDTLLDNDNRSMGLCIHTWY